MRAAALSAGALLVSLLAAEGALSLLAGRSLAELAGREPMAAVRREAPRAPRTPPSVGTPRASDALQPEADAGLGEIYAPHEDPRVGYVLRPAQELFIFEGRIESDHLGLRRRPGPPPPDEALRIVVLGDSVAFGFGVDDDQTLAARLEARLTELRGPLERPVACRTVAIPSWNHRAAAAFLLDHWDELRPELVLYLPIANDVYDLDGVRASGARRAWPDPSAADPWLTVSVRHQVSSLVGRFLQGAGGELTARDLGPDVVLGDACAESRRRHDENADTIARLDGLLAARGCRLALVWNLVGDYTWFLASRLAERAPDLPSIALLRTTRGEFTLGHDPHANAETLDVWARWLALELVERGWVSRGEGRPLEPVPAPHAEARASPLPAAAECRRLADESRRRGAELLLPAIDFRTGGGLLQVFGGLNPDLSARCRLLAVLQPEGEALEVELAPVADRPDLYPLPVVVEIAGRRAGELTVTAGDVVRARLPLPAGVDRSEPLEVRLIPERWVVRARGATRVDLVSFRPLRLECVAP